MLEFNGLSCICDERPMILGIEKQINLSDKYGTELQLEYCGCDKIGDGKFCVYGFCEDAFIERPTSIVKGSVALVELIVDIKRSQKMREGKILFEELDIIPPLDILNMIMWTKYGWKSEITLNIHEIQTLNGS